MATVTDQTGFKNAITNLEPEIIIANDIELTSSNSITYAVSIKGNPGVSLFWGNPTAANPNMLIVTATGNLTIGSLTLDARGKNGTFVQVNGGSFTMNEGTVMKNITSTTSQGNVKVGDLETRVGGKFIMNGGLITGMKGSDSVFCADATIEMNNDAAIDGNEASGMAMIWSKLTMSGRARISNNTAKQMGGGCMVVESELTMGVNEGDAPAITGNSSPYDCGGIFLTNDSKLTMRYGAEVSGNYALNFAGGIGAQDSVISMRENAAIKNNRTDGEACGLVLSKNTTTVMEDHAQITGHVSGGRGGGIYMQSGAVLQMKGDACVFGNNAVDGAGIFLNASSASIGMDDSAASIFENRAAGKGGGVFISSDSVLEVTGKAGIYGNTAAQGNGIYKVGDLNLSGSARISDGLHLGESSLFASPAFRLGQADGEAAGLGAEKPFEPYSVVIIIDPIEMEKTAEGGDFAVPVITGSLTDGDLIQLEASDYISTEKVPLLIAEKGADCARLGEADRAAWRLPSDFEPGYEVILNDALDAVLAACKKYKIIYNNLHGADNPNPASYALCVLPITLRDPGQRPGYVFKGWYDAKGQLVTQIPKGTTGDVTLSASWEKLFVQFVGNGHCISNMPEAINIEAGETIPIPSTIPSRHCYCFTGWNTSASGDGIAYAPGGVISVSDSGVTLYAQWHRLANCCARDRDRR